MKLKDLVPIVLSWLPGDNGNSLFLQNVFNLPKESCIYIYIYPQKIVNKCEVAIPDFLQCLKMTS